MPGVTYCEFKKGETIISQGDKVEYIYYLISGICYRTEINAKGDAITYGTKQSGDFIKSLIGVLMLYSNVSSSAHFIAKSKCCCYKIPKDVFFQYINDKPEMLSQLLYLAERGYGHLLSLFRSKQEKTIANLLCELLLNNAVLKEGKLLVNKTFSNNAEIAGFLGIHKVTVSKILKTLKTEGVITKEKEGVIILDEEEMSRYAKVEKTIIY